MNPEVEGDILKYIEYSVTLAETLLKDAGDFFPFGAKIDLAGQLTTVGFWDEEEFPESQKLIEGLRKALGEELQQDKIRSYCVSYDVRVTNGKYPATIDALLITIRHQQQEGELHYYYPYTLGEGLEVQFMQPWASQ